MACFFLSLFKEFRMSTETRPSAPESLVPTPFVEYATPHALAQALYDYAHRDFGRMKLRPFNRFGPDDTFWWLCPESDDPAYRFGKYIAKTAGPCADLFAGVCFEKGLGPSAAALFKETRMGKSLIVRENWVWNAFFAAFGEGDFDRYVLAAQHAADLPVNVIVSAGMMKPPSSGMPEREGAGVLPQQLVYYLFDNSRITLLQDVPVTDILLANADDCSTLSDVATKIREIRNIDWIWITVEFGFSLISQPVGSCSPSQLSAKSSAGAF